MAAGWERTVAIVAAGLGVVIAIPVVLVAGLFLLVSSMTFDGCEANLGPNDAGVSAAPGGAVRIHTGPCAPGLGFESVRVRAADGTVVWLAEGTAGADENPSTPPAFDTLVVGQAPSGFADVVPLAAPLDPAATYTAELSLLDSASASSIAGTGGSTASTSSADAVYTVLGQTATFRPADLFPGRVDYHGEHMTEDAFARLTCSDSDE
jgi:hypothetical protein